MFKKLRENIKFEIDLLEIDWLRIILSVLTSVILIGLGMFIFLLLK